MTNTSNSQTFPLNPYQLRTCTDDGVCSMAYKSREPGAAMDSSRENCASTLVTTGIPLSCTI